MAEIRLKSTGTIKLFENDNTSSVTIASPASLAADRTITLPDASVTLASGTMLATDGSGASLTALNATQLGSGTVPDARFPATLPAASGVNLTSLDAANLGSNTVPTARLGSGTASSSTVLYGDQTYKAEPGGAFTKLLTVTASASANMDFDSTYINSTYRRYLFLFSNLLPAVENGAVEIEHSDDNGSSFLSSTTDYVNHLQYNSQGSTEYYLLQGGAQSSALLSNTNIGSGSGEGCDGELWFQRADATHYVRAASVIVGTNNSNAMVWQGGYTVMSTGINFVRIGFSNGNVTSGHVTLYGVEN